MLNTSTEKTIHWTYKWDKSKKLTLKSKILLFWLDWYKKFSLNLAKNRQEVAYKGIDIYYIGYFKIKKFSDCEKIHSVNPLYLITPSATG